MEFDGVLYTKPYFLPPAGYPTILYSPTHYPLPFIPYPLTPIPYPLVFNASFNLGF